MKTLTGPGRFEVEEDCQSLDCVKGLHPVFFVHFRFDGGECRLDEVVQRVKIKIYQVVQPFIISICRRKEAVVSFTIIDIHVVEVGVTPFGLFKEVIDHFLRFCGDEYIWSEEGVSWWDDLSIT